MKTLIVEDDYTCRTCLREMLRPYGEIRVAVNGKEAIEIVRAARAEGVPYDLVCLDIMMPEMNGHDVLKVIREDEEADGILLGCGTKIIMTTCLGDGENVIVSFRESCDAYLVKPIDGDKLIEHLVNFKLIETPGTTPAKRKPNIKILFADDDATTRVFTQSILAQWDYDMVVARDGNQAWEILNQADPPRLVLLDWVMPGKSGLELCRLIRHTEGLVGTYVILLSVKNSQEDLLSGLDAGADDYLSKPWDECELKCRIMTGERVLAYQDEINEKAKVLAVYATQMEERAEERARQLVHADRLTTVGILSAQVIHEINNPLSAILGNRNLLSVAWEQLAPHLKAIETAGAQPSGEKIPKPLEYLINEFPEILADIQKGGERIMRLVRSFRRYSRAHSRGRVHCRVEDLVRNTLDFCNSIIKNRVLPHVDIPEDIPELIADAQQLEQVLINLIVNAADMVKPPSQVNLFITARAIEDRVELTVEDDGPGFSEKALDNLWKQFFTTKDAEHGTGLGMSISRGIIESHGGTITARNRKEGGACIRIRLPACADAEGQE